MLEKGFEICVSISNTAVDKTTPTNLINWTLYVYVSVKIL